MKFENCEKAGLLTPTGKTVRVWSGPLYRHLGDKRYQEFIEFNASRWKSGPTHNTPCGFDPIDVEEFLSRNGRPAK